MTLFFLRLATVASLLALAAGLAVRPERGRLIFLNYFGARSGPLNVAIFRIVVFSQLCRWAGQLDVAAILGVPATLQKFPPGWAWVGEALPLFHPNLVHAGQLITAGASALVVIGLGTRFAAPLAAFGAVYLFLLPNSFTKINHAGHALVWSALVLSASPCGDALSLDAWVRTYLQGRPQLSLDPRQSMLYALPLRFCWLLFGIGYFFSGLAKLWDSGDQWLDGQALVARLTFHGVTGFDAALPLYEYPFLASLAGAGTLFFELGFVFLILFDRTRPFATLAGIGFHFGVKEIMNISFIAMLKLYVSLVDFERILNRFSNRLPVLLRESLALRVERSPLDASAAHGGAKIGFIVVIGSLLVVANAYAGYARVDSWPITSLPRFSERVSATSAKSCKNRMAIVRTSGKSQVVNARKLRSPIKGARWNSLLDSIRSAKTKQERRERFEASAVLLRNSSYPVARGDELAIERTCLVEKNGKKKKIRTLRYRHRITQKSVAQPPLDESQ